jgi:hypothetical protein
MKNVVVAGAALLCLGAGCQDTRVTNLEQRVNRLDESVRRLELERTKSSADDAARRAKLENCVAEANTEFQRNVVSNGTKARNGSYNVPIPAITEMQKQKQGKIEECRLLYSK